MGQFAGCIEGIAAACSALAFPVVSGNVSLYNETSGEAILPTPVIGGVGLIHDLGKAVRVAFPAAGEAVVLIGRTAGWLGASIYLREILGREEGAPPPVDLSAERAQRRFRPRHDRIGHGDRMPRSLRRRPPGGPRRDGDGGRDRLHRDPARGRPAAPRLALRRGPGALSRHHAHARRAPCPRRRFRDRGPASRADRRLRIDSRRQRTYIGGRTRGRSRILVPAFMAGHDAGPDEKA